MTEVSAIVEGGVVRPLKRVELPERQRATLELACFEELSLRDVAERLGVSVGCTRHYYYRGLARLQAWARVAATVLCAAILRASRMAAGLAASSLQSSACRMPSRSLAPLYIGKRRAALAAAGASAAEFAHVARPVLIVEQP